MLSLQGHGARRVSRCHFRRRHRLQHRWFAFSALCGALLFHLMDSPVYAVQVMILCSIAIQLFSVATLWHSIDWRSLPVFLVGGFLGVPVGRLAAAAPSERRLSRCDRRPAHRLWQLSAAANADAGNNPSRAARRTSAPVFSAAFTGGLAGFPGAFVTDLVRPEGMGQGTPARCCISRSSSACSRSTLIAIHLMRPASSAQRSWTGRSLAFVPAALLGAWFGLRIFKRLSDRQFELVVNRCSSSPASASSFESFQLRSPHRRLAPAIRQRSPAARQIPA